jgi:site-specific DNA-methyltransferase (adenine-specific)
MRDLPDCSVDSVVCDPPYHLTSIVKRFGAENAAPAKVGKTGAYARASKGFMGQTWDGGDVAFQPETWAEVLRVLKPGGHLVAFSGTRTYHRMAVAIEDAGFEVRDMIAWHYGSGFPKSHDISKAIDRGEDYKLQSAFRRAYVEAVEDAGLTLPGNSRHDWTTAEHAPGDRWWAEFQKWLPTLSSVQREVIDRAVVAKGFRVRRESVVQFCGTSDGEYNITAPATDAAREWEGWGTALKPATEPICLARKPISEKSIAANVLKWGTGALNIDGCRIEGTKPQVTQGVNSNPTSFNVAKERRLSGDPSEGRWPANLCHDGSDEVVAGFPESDSKGGGGSPSTGYWGNAGGCEGLIRDDSGSAARFFYCAKTTTEERGEGNNHPTVKPVALMRWLTRLVTPKGGTVLDPFMGSGSTALACDAEQFDFIGCELSADYAAIAEKRIRDASGLFADISIEHASARAAA